MMRKLLVPLLLAISLVGFTTWSSCVPPQEEEIITTIRLDVKDTLFQRIVDAQDLRKPASLYNILHHPDPTYRYLAARAFASFADSTVIDSLSRLLNDPVEEVRNMAVFALGQTHSLLAIPPLIDAFVQEDTAMIFATTHRAILEAVGKCGQEEHLAQLSGISTYTPRDTALLAGQAWGLYRFGLRNYTSEAATQRMITLTKPAVYPVSVRLVAAHYLARFQVGIDSLQTPALITSFERSNEPDIRMALAIALGKTQRSEALTSLIGQYQRERDYRVKCNILKALSNFPYENGRTLATEALRDPNEHIARRAVQYLLEHSSPEDATQWWRFAKDSLTTPIRLALYQVANRHLPAYRVEFRDAINAELRQIYTKSTNPYEQAEALSALAEFPWNYRFLTRELQQNPSPIIKTAAVEGLKSISEKAVFEQYFGLSARRVTKELAVVFTQAIQSGEPGVVATAAQALRFEKRNYKAALDSIHLLKTAWEQLELPAMTEPYNELGQTIAFLEGRSDFVPHTPTFNRPINWKLLERAGAAPRVRLVTSRGNIDLELWATEAPGSVANMLQLVGEGFFKDTYFHRVVPNFVIQGGSPNGEAYASPDFSIRSELTDRHYDQEGLLGMASAGRDTESSQFFITHSPALHLDGNYSLFGRVVAGMENVHKIQVGDRITRAEILK
ncbi:MAG: peptidylprolyl isomerase [Saprospiraceae bacterium]